MRAASGRGGPRLHAPLLLALVAAFNLFSGFTAGGNLVASYVAARSFSLVAAAALVLCGTALGPWLVGTAVAHTVVFSLIALPRLGEGVSIAAAAGALLSLAFCWWRALPTSTSLALVGALAGAGLAHAGLSAVHWLGVAVVIAGMGAALGAGAGAGWAVSRLARRLLRLASEGALPLLRALQTVTGLLQGFAYGGNDAEKAVGLFAFAAAWGTAGGRAALDAGRMAVPAWCIWGAIATFGVGILVGGFRIARTVGFGLYRVRTSDALSAQFAAGAAVTIAAALGEPVSSSQTSTAALIAAGAARRLSLPRWSLVWQMVRSWLFTLPIAFCAGGVLSLAFGRW